MSDRQRLYRARQRADGVEAIVLRGLSRDLVGQVDSPPIALAGRSRSEALEHLVAQTLVVVAERPGLVGADSERARRWTEDALDPMQCHPPLLVDLPAPITQALDAIGARTGSRSPRAAALRRLVDVGLAMRIDTQWPPSGPTTEPAAGGVVGGAVAISRPLFDAIAESAAGVDLEQILTEALWLGSRLAARVTWLPVAQRALDWAAGPPAAVVDAGDIAPAPAGVDHTIWVAHLVDRGLAVRRLLSARALRLEARSRPRTQRAGTRSSGEAEAMPTSKGDVTMT